MNDSDKQNAAQVTHLPVAAAPKRETIIVESEVPVLDTGLFEQMQRIAKIMAASNLVPEHLNRAVKSGNNITALTAEEAFANCFLVVNQSVRWHMDPFAVAQGVFVLRGKVGYEGKLIAAVINSRPELEQRLSYRYEGAGPELRVTVSGKVRGDSAAREISGSVKQWATENASWKNIPEQMLAYRGAREWARRWMPEAILGVDADEEVEQIAIDVTPSGAAPAPASSGAADRLRAVLAAPEPARAEPSGTAKAEPTGTAQAGPIATSETTAEAGAAQAKVDAIIVDEGDAALASRFETPAAAPAPAAEPAKAEAPKPAKPKGTPKIRKQFSDSMAATKDRNDLSSLYADVDLYVWSPEDREALAKAYAKREHELKG